VRIIEFELREDFIPLDDLLKATAMASSGGAAKAMISRGKVRLDGVIELRKSCKIFAGQIVEMETASIRIHARTRPTPFV
jgi:ribosome-associated protein